MILFDDFNKLLDITVLNAHLKYDLGTLYKWNRQNDISDVCVL